MAHVPEKLYPIAIPSISDIHPGIPPQIVRGFHLDESIGVGDPVQLSDAKNAEDDVIVVTSMQDRDPSITPDVVETAKNRAAAIRSTHSFLEFGSAGAGGILDLLNRMNERLLRIDTRLLRIEIRQVNARITKRNRARQAIGPGQMFQWRQKEIAGSGTLLARALNGGAVLPANVAVDPPPAVGAFAAPLNPFSASANDILRLVSFYNEDFMIFPDDTLHIRREKLLRWLTDDI